MVAFTDSHVPQHQNSSAVVSRSRLRGSEFQKSVQRKALQRSTEEHSSDSNASDMRVCADKRETKQQSRKKKRDSSTEAAPDTRFNDTGTAGHLQLQDRIVQFEEVHEKRAAAGGVGGGSRIGGMGLGGAGGRAAVSSSSGHPAVGAAAGGGTNTLAMFVGGRSALLIAHGDHE
jgi:hypothetical protein